MYGRRGEEGEEGIQLGDVRRQYAINCFNTEVRTAGRWNCPVRISYLSSATFVWHIEIGETSSSLMDALCWTVMRGWSWSWRSSELFGNGRVLWVHSTFILLQHVYYYCSHSLILKFNQLQYCIKYGRMLQPCRSLLHSCNNWRPDDDWHGWNMFPVFTRYCN